MKKVLLIASLLVYFCVSTGFVLNLHYCMGELDEVAIGHNDDERCGACGMETGIGNCCRDEVEVVKLAEAHYPAPALEPFFGIEAPVSELNEFLLSPFYNFQGSPGEAASPPPLLHEPPIHVLNCVFRI